jgi:hypothetical protein
VGLEILVAPGADGHFDLIEDDGTGTTPDTIPTARTPITWDQAAGTLTIGPATGASHVVPKRRTWTVTLLGVDGIDGVAGTGADFPTSVTVTGAASDATTMTVTPDLQPRSADVRGRLLEVVRRAQFGFEAKAAVWTTLTSGRPARQQIAELQAQDVPASLVALLTELLSAR